MEEDRMLSDEILLGIINAKSGGGGGGGTDDYNDLKNQPKIEGVTLKGNKTAADLGLATAAALADKVDKVQGKGLSTNDFTDAYKNAIGANTTAISGIKNGEEINSFGGVETALSDVSDDVGSLKSGLTNVEIALSVPVGTGRNKLDISGFETNTRHNITVTQNNNGTVTVTGTAAADATDVEQLGNVTKAGQYILTGCPAGGSNSTFRLDVRRGADVIAYDYGTGTGPVNMQVGDTINLRYANLYVVPEGGLLFKPMLRLSTDTDTTFTQYIPSVDSRIGAVQEQVNEIETRVAIVEKRKLKWFNISIPAGSTQLDITDLLPADFNTFVNFLCTGGSGVVVVQYNINQKTLYFLSAPANQAVVRAFYY